MNQAELAAAGRTYRIADGRPSDSCLATKNRSPHKFLEDGTIEIKIEDPKPSKCWRFAPSTLPSSEGSDESK